jgi:hypothetical protein
MHSHKTDPENHFQWASRARHTQGGTSPDGLAIASEKEAPTGNPTLFAEGVPARWQFVAVTTYGKETTGRDGIWIYDSKEAKGRRRVEGDSVKETLNDHDPANLRVALSRRSKLALISRSVTRWV